MSNTVVSSRRVARWSRSADNSEIQMLVGAAVSYRDKMDIQSIRDKIFAIDHPEVRIELGESGGYEGPEHVRAYLDFWAEFFTQPEDKRGWMDFQHLAEPLIVFSEDGDRARGMWPFFSPQAKHAMPHGADERMLTALWVCGKYDIEFIRINGRWKVLKLQQIFYMRTPYDGMAEAGRLSADTAVPCSAAGYAGTLLFLSPGCSVFRGWAIHLGAVHSGMF